MRMASRYGHAWVSQYGALPDGIAAAEWRETLAGITREQLRDGFAEDALRASDWPPSSPRFRAMCLSIPPIGYVRSEVLELLNARQPRNGEPDQLDVCRFTRLVWSWLNVYAFRESSGNRADRMLREAYELACDHVMSGGGLPPTPVAAIEQEREAHKPASPDVAKAHLDKIAEMLKTAPVKPHTEVDE